MRDLIFERIEKLAKNRRPENVEPLKGVDIGLFRIRQGDYRIVYTIEDQKLWALIVRVVHTVTPIPLVFLLFRIILSLRIFRISDILKVENE